MTCSIRGAITAEENTRDCVLENTRMLLNKIIKENDLDLQDIISVIFTATNDIDSVYPAVAARGVGIVEAGLMCVQEMFVEGSLQMCVRVLVIAETDKKQRDMKHVYLKGAVKLRPDLAEKSKRFVSIAIDGPAGSGKSTVAKLLAKELDYIYVDTGAMYRTVALYCIENGIDTKNFYDVEAALDNISIELKHQSNEQRIYLNGSDVTEKIRTQEVAAGSSDVAVIQEVRERLVYVQKKIAEKNNVIMDGRDIGTCVLPDAAVKIYMDADVSERAERRCHELSEKNIDFDFEKIKQEIIERDENDKNRKFSPLIKAEDAVLIDASRKNIDEVKSEVLDIIKKRICNI